MDIFRIDNSLTDLDQQIIERFVPPRLSRPLRPPHARWHRGTPWRTAAATAAAAATAPPPWPR